MCRCPILLKKVVIPENRADIQQNCIPVIVTVDLNPWFQEVQLRSTKTGHMPSKSAIAQWRSRLNARVRVNGGYCEHKFWASDFLLCFVCFGDTGFCKCDRYKHVQSANIAVKCVTFVSDNFTRYGSNITNVWQDIFSPMTLAFSCEVVHEKFVKVTAKKSVAPFFWTRCTLRKLALLEAWTCLKR